jgi:2-oxoglutarate dehydrogenase E1 component
MTSSAPITSVFNDGYIAEMYELYRRDPTAVEQFLAAVLRLRREPGRGGGRRGEAPAPAAADGRLLRKVAGAAALIQAIRTYGHLAVPIDPLGTPPKGRWS